MLTPQTGFELYYNGKPVLSMGNRSIYMTEEAAKRNARRLGRLHSWRCEIRLWTA